MDRNKGYFQGKNPLARTLAVVVTLIMSVSFITGCEDEDTNDLALAQECLNDAPQSPEAAATAAAIECRKYVKGKSSKESKTLSCSIEMLAGGLTVTKVSNAMGQLSDPALGGQAEMNMMLAIAMNTTDQATTAFNACAASDSEGLVFLAGLSRMGTIMKVLGGSDPSASACATPGTCDDTSVGQTAEVLSASYCGENQGDDNENEELCGEFAKCDSEAANGTGGTEDSRRGACVNCVMNTDEANRAANCYPNSTI